MTKRKDSGISIFCRNDGRWVLAYQLEPGKWRQHVLKATQEKSATREAHAWLAKERANGALSVGRTIDDLWRTWIKLRAASPNLATSTVRDNETHFEKTISPALGAIPLDKLAPARIRDFVRAIRDGRSASGVRNIISSLSAFYEDARAEGWVTSPENVVRHPAVTKEMPEAGNETEGVVYVKLEHAQALVLSDRVHAHRRARYTVAFLTGLRDGELLGLTWADIFLDAEIPYLSVDKQFANKASPEKYADLTDTKTPASVRAVPLHPAAAAALRWWRDEGWPLFVTRDPGPTDAVFASVNGNHWRPKSAREIREDLALAGQPTKTDLGESIDFHATRRSFSTWLEDAGADPDCIDRMLGHKGKSTRAKHYTAAVLGRYASALALLAFRWQDPGAGSSLSTSGGPHNAHLVPAHNEGDETAPAPVAQWIEQRFPKPTTDASESIVSDGSSVDSDGDDERPSRESFDAARFEDRAARFGGLRVNRLHLRESRRRAIEDELQAIVLDGVQLAMKPLPMDDKQRRMRGLLARGAVLAAELERRKAKGAA